MCPRISEMPYSLLALVGTDLSEASRNGRLAQPIALSQGFELIPLAAPDLTRLSGDDRLVGGDNAFPQLLTPTASEKLSKLQIDRFAYLEIDCFGGDCNHSAAVYDGSQPRWMGSQIHAELNHPVSGERLLFMRPTNIALRAIGVQLGDSRDELEALGLTNPPWRQAWWNFERFSLSSK